MSPKLFVLFGAIPLPEVLPFPAAPAVPKIEGAPMVEPAVTIAGLACRADGWLPMGVKGAWNA